MLYGTCIHCNVAVTEGGPGCAVLAILPPSSSWMCSALTFSAQVVADFCADPDGTLRATQDPSLAGRPRSVCSRFGVSCPIAHCTLQSIT